MYPVKGIKKRLESPLGNGFVISFFGNFRLCQMGRKSGRDRPLDLLDSRDRPSKNYEG
jgi:hypothetical protein